MKSPLPPTGIGGAERLVFILGHPLEHSLSPLMHNAAFRALRMPWAYAPLDILKDQVGSAVEILRSSNVHGANVTVPYKEDVLPHLDKVEKEAAWLGSVNTIYRRGERLWGTSTDGEGFLRSLGPWRKKLRGSRGLLVGAGGAAKAVAEALARSGARGIFIANRSSSRAQQLVRLLLKRHRGLKAGAVSLREGEKLMGGCDWVIQSTSLGLKTGDPSPLSLAGAQRTTLAVDLIYNRSTTFLKDARRIHLSSLDGLGMLLHQGALSFEYWTGRKAPLEMMRSALLRRLVSSSPNQRMGHPDNR